MPKIKIEREKCIGCGSCTALCSKYFELIDDGKSHLKGNNNPPVGGVEELEVEKIECAEQAAEACPAQCIHIER
jgi:ferredoxin